MGGERQGPKSGGFFQLFDWNAKSRKKLFSSKSDLPEHSKQGKKGDGSFPTSRIRMVEEYEMGALSNKGSSDYSCASSVTDEEGYVNKAPNVVARLMGLDSLPTSNSNEPYSSPFFDTQSLNELQFRRRDLHFYQEHQTLNTGEFFNEAHSRPMEKSHSRPIEKFQRESLPPKSAKSIPITQHKLLSPIKKPGFVQSNDVAHIMEAAARIIEPGPQATARSRMKASVPLKVRELKEKTVESNGARSLNRQQSLNRSLSGSVGTSFRAESSGSTKNKGKSINLALQAKVNVQKRKGMNNVERMKEDEASGLTQSGKSESSSQTVTARRKPSVLRQNNRKQNFNAGKENVHPSKTSSTNNVHGRKAAQDLSQGHQRSLCKDSRSSRVGSKKSSLDKDDSQSGPRNVTRKKRSIHGKLQEVRNDSGGESMLIDRNESTSQSNSVAERNFPWAEESRRKGGDVVSFTFTTPMAQSGGIEPPRRLAEDRNNIFAENRSKKFMLRQEDMKLSSLGYDVMGDSLSVLLEQKLRELTYEASSASAWQNSNMLYERTKAKRLQDKNDPEEMQIDDMYNQMLSYFSSAEPRGKYNLQGGEMDACSSTKVENRQLYKHQRPIRIPILDSSDLTESFNSSSNCTESTLTEESKMQWSSDHGQEMVNISCLGKNHHLDTEMEISDSASSSKDESCFKGELPKSPAEWELDYIKDILSNVELMFKDCASGRTRDIINPHLFDQMERKRGSSSSYKDAPLSEKKDLFDCVRERLDVRCQRFVGGGFRALEKGLALVRRKGKLAEDVYKEIQEWRGMRNCMVDELVDKDMSIEHGKWHDFDEDGSGIGVDVEEMVFDGLVDELIGDILGVRHCGYAELLSRVV